MHDPVQWVQERSSWMGKIYLLGLILVIGVIILWITEVITPLCGLSLLVIGFGIIAILQRMVWMMRA